MKPRWKAATVSASLSALFLIVYTTCNWITNHRSNIGSLHFEWERHIPFIPLLILPYMSIDLFFIAAPFLARSERELRTLANRLTAAILIAGTFFLLFPLKFAFERPHVDGPLGLIFNNFRSVDLPFNEFPSLHVALCLILLDTYFRHTTRWLRGLVMIWFSLILASTVFTYQHHLVDVVGGMGLAFVCFYAFRDQPFRQPLSPNPRIALYYATGAIIFSLLAFCFTPWSRHFASVACMHISNNGNRLREARRGNFPQGGGQNSVGGVVHDVAGVAGAASLADALRAAGSPLRSTHGACLDRPPPLGEGSSESLCRWRKRSGGFGR